MTFFQGKNKLTCFTFELNDDLRKASGWREFQNLVVRRKKLVAWNLWRDLRLSTKNINFAQLLEHRVWRRKTTWGNESEVNIQLFWRIFFLQFSWNSCSTLYLMKVASQEGCRLSQIQQDRHHSWIRQIRLHIVLKIVRLPNLRRALIWILVGFTYLVDVETYYFSYIKENVSSYNRAGDPQFWLTMKIARINKFRTIRTSIKLLFLKLKK